MKKNFVLLLYIFISHLAVANDVSLNAISNSFIEKITTKYGMSVLFMKKSDLPIVALNISFRNSGYSYDSPSKQGLAYFVSQIMREGTENKNVVEFNKELKKIGAQIFTSVDKENFTVSLRVLSENFEQAAVILRQSIFSLKTDDATIKRLKSKQIAILNKEMEDPNFIAMTELSKILYASHPYSNSIFGTKSTIESFTATDIKEYAKSSFNMINAVISAVGNVTNDLLIATLDKTIVDLPLVVKEVKKVPSVKIDNSKRSKRDFFFEMDVPQNVIYFARDAVEISDDDYYHTVFLNYILGGSGGFNSLLMSALRSDKGLTYGIKTDIINNKHSDVFIGFLSTANKTSPEAIATVKKVIENTRYQGIKLKHFEAAKYNIINSFVLNLETSSQLIQLLNYIQLNNLPINYVEDYLRAVDKVSLNGLNSFARKFLDLNQFVFVEVGKQLESKQSE